QWVLNYTQGKQLSLLKDIGFESPSWEDLSYVLLGIIVVAALGGAGWTLWDRAQHDPWLRLLARARKRLAPAGIESTPATSPRQLALLVQQKYGTGPGGQGQALHDWLVRLELQHYAGASGNRLELNQLRQEFDRLAWPA
ncbi:MAG: DUF3488 domain-containing protein, partial [Polaromonas sp.]|nr:DUF3488 domain-containing protein [Polaromonas sp.]